VKEELYYIQMVNGYKDVAAMRVAIVITGAPEVHADKTKKSQTSRPISICDIPIQDIPSKVLQAVPVRLSDITDHRS
jgi:hypothetical protein